jgi:hypothetical protein
MHRRLGHPVIVSLLAPLAACAGETVHEEPAQVAAVSGALTTHEHPLAHTGHLGRRVRAALCRSALRIAGLQADQLGDNAGNGLDDADPDDGGWDWTLPADAEEHTSGPSALNTYGATALGPLLAVRAGCDEPRLETLLHDAALGIQDNSEIHAAPDLTFLTLAAATFDDPGLGELGRARYDAQLELAGSADALGTRLRDERHAGGQDALIPYDLALRTLALESLAWSFPDGGYDGDADAFAELAIADLTNATPLFDVTRDDDPAYYTHGIAWSTYLLARDGRHPELQASVRGRLLSLQHEDGAWGVDAHAPDADPQATAYAVEALALSADGGDDAQLAAARGRHWLLSHRAADGCYHVADIENPQVCSEALVAIALAPRD